MKTTIFLVIDKPKGGGHQGNYEDTLVNALLLNIKNLSNINEF